MILRFASVLVLSSMLWSHQAFGGSILFNNTEVPTINNQDVVTNQWNSYGISVQNAYWYTDNRDPFDEMGLSVHPIGATTAARIDLLFGPTNSLTVDWWTIDPNRILIEAYNAANVLLDSFSGIGSGSETLSGTGIAYFTWRESGGFVQISTLTCDTCGLGKVPEPGSLLLLGAGFAGLFGFWRRSEA